MGCVVVALAAGDSLGPLAVLWLFLRRYRARERRGGMELPHF